MISIYDLVKPVTYNEAKTSLYEALATVGVDATLWKRVSVYRVVVAAVAIMYSVTTVLLAGVAAAGWYELSSGSWLTLVARYMYGVYRDEATFAQGAMVFVNSGGAVYDVAVGEMVVRNPTSRAEYANLTAFTIASGSVLSPTTTDTDVDGNPIMFRALVAGEGGTSGAERITALVTTLVNVTCKNPLALVGRAEEDDDSVKTRCREKLVDSSPFGPEEKYASVARATKRPDGSSIGLNRIAITKDGKGNVFVDCASIAGQIAGAEEDAGTDLFLINDAIQKRATPLSVTSHVRSQTPVVIPYTYEVWMLQGSGLSKAQARNVIESTVAQRLGNAPLGGFHDDGAPGYVFYDWIQSTIENAIPEVFRVELTVPANDVPVPAGRAPVAGAATCINVHQVSQRSL